MMVRPYGGSLGERSIFALLSRRQIA